MLATNEKAVESRLRRRAIRQGYCLMRSRWRLGSIDNLGGYSIIDANHNFVVAGSRFDLSLDDVEAWLSDS